MVVRSQLCYLFPLLGLMACDRALSVDAAGASRPLELAETAVVPRELQAALERDQRVNVIVSLRERGAHAEDRAHKARAIAEQFAGLQAWLDADMLDARSFRHTPAFSATLTHAAVMRLLRHPEVASLQLDHRGRAQLMEAVPAVQAARVHSALGLTGKGVRVAVLDTGVEADHPDLRGAVVAQRCFLRGGCPPLQRNEGSDATDDNGHGTSIAGVIASRGFVSAQGFAPDAEIVALKVLAADSTGQESDWVAALDWIYDNLDQLQVKLVNLSFVSELLFDDGSCDRAAPALTAAIANLTRAGVAVFGASGNNGSSTQLAVPACTTGVIAVGASYDADVGPMPSASGTYNRLIGPSFADCRDEASGPMRLTCYTNSSPRLDVIAPGSPITSDWIGGGTSLRGGTSYASAAATGIGALLLQCNRALTPSALRRALTDTGLPLVDARNGLSFPLVQAADAARQACPTLQDAGTSHMPDAAVAAPDAAMSAADAAVHLADAALPSRASDAGLQPRAAGVIRASAEAGAQAVAASAADDEPLAPVKLSLPKRRLKPSAGSASRAAGSCACASPGHMQGWYAYAAWSGLALCSWLRRARRRVKRAYRS